MRTVTFIAANLLADTAATAITVSSAFCAPAVTAPATVSSFSGTRIEIFVSALDPDGDPLTSLTADLSNLPAGHDAIFGITAPDRSSGLLTWTPTPAVDGVFPVTFTASNLFSGAATTQIVVTSIIGPVTRRVSVSSAGAEGNASSYSGRISTDGRYVVFHSNASNLVPGDTNVRSDVFRRDLIAQTTELVSAAASGAQGNGASHNAFVSADGRFVAFSSTATNLVSGDANGVEDVFLRDMVAGTTERISVDAASLEGNGWSFVSGMSDDGRIVAFCSDASNLVPGDANGTTDVFVRDRDTGTTTLVSRNSGGTQANARCCENSAGHMSADGRFVVFPSIATNLVADDLNGRNDVFLHDRTTETTEIVSRSTAGDPSNGLSAWPAVSADGRYVAFSSFGSTLVPGDNNYTWDVFVRDRTLGATERVTVNSSEMEANANSGYAALTAVGEAVAFHSYASNLIPSDANGISDIFLRDRVQGTTERVSVAGTSGEPTGPNAEVGVISASGDGRMVVFCMAATNLVPGDLNGAIDVFVRDRQQTISTGNSEPTPLSRRVLWVYPNPSERGITISLYAPLGPAPIVRIYDVQGRLVRDLGAARTNVVPIHFAWDGRDERGRTVAAGVYFAVASDGRHPLARKVVIAR
jgi:Tol biopolymer transport system component